MGITPLRRYYEAVRPCPVHRYFRPDSYYYVLPMVPKQDGPIGGKTPVCPADSEVVLYSGGPAANQAVYECKTGVTWLADANLAASKPFGMTGKVPGAITERRPYPHPRPVSIAAPQIVGGAMLFATAKQWGASLNTFNNGGGYLGSNRWRLPDSPANLKTLYDHLHLSPGDSRLRAKGRFGPFQNLQPFFYWEKCVIHPNEIGKTSADRAAGNAPGGGAGAQMNYDFTLGYGMQSTDASWLRYFVMVYYPASSPSSVR